jgi:8-oxo-dGTP pyrophosphatase MutT (NUDIX family)
MPSVVFILVDAECRVLMEQRPDLDSHFPHEWMFPGGKLERGEGLVPALRRELREELGVSRFAKIPLAHGEPVFYETQLKVDGGTISSAIRLYPYLVFHWEPEEVPLAVLDSGSSLAWRPLKEAAASPIDCTRLLAVAALRALGAA